MPQQKASSFADDLAKVQSRSFADDLDAGKQALGKATSIKATSAWDRSWPVQTVRGAIRGYEDDPEGFIDQAGPMAGASMGMAAGGPPGAAVGAGLGYLYGKGNRAVSNLFKGKPVMTGFPKTVGEEGWNILQNWGGAVGPEIVVPGAAAALKAGGRSLVRRSIMPNRTALNHASEMAGRGTLPQDVANQVAETAHEVAGSKFWSPMSQGATRNLMSEAVKGADANTALVRGVTDAGTTIPYAPIVGEAGGRSLAAVKGGLTPGEVLPGVRSRLQSLMHDPESRMTVPYESWTMRPGGAGKVLATSLPAKVENGAVVQGLPGAARGETMLQGIAPQRAVRTTPVDMRIPNPETNPSDLLTGLRMLSGDLRANWGAKNSAQSAVAGLDKNVYHGGVDTLKDVTPGLREGMDREHRIMNALDPIINKEVQQSNAKPINLYTMLGIVGGNPSAVALGAGNWPVAMGAAGHGAWRFGEKLSGEIPWSDLAGQYTPGLGTPQQIKDAIRAATLLMMRSKGEDPNAPR